MRLRAQGDGCWAGCFDFWEDGVGVLEENEREGRGRLKVSISCVSGWVIYMTRA